MSDIVKKETDVVGGLGDASKKPLSIAERLAAKREKMKAGVGDDTVDATGKKNRVALILDSSGSMGHAERPDSPINLLKQAVEAYVNHCDMNDTSVALVPFGHRGDRYHSTPLSCDKSLLILAVQVYNGTGGTPMHNGLNEAIGQNSITRAVLVSDGQPDSEDAAYEAANAYVETKTPVDCVHIGDGCGENVLKRIAEMTGGIYVKFKDMHTFVGSFKYLTPGFRAMLMSGDAAALLGSDEVIK